MELYIKNSREDYLEVIDLEYPQYMFVMDGIRIGASNGNLEIVVDKASVVKSAVGTSPNEVPVESEDEFLEKHTQKIISEIFDSLSKNTIP